MIKNSAHIRRFTPEQKRQLEAISKTEGLKNATGVLLFALDKYQDHINQIARRDRIIVLKQKKIEQLKNPEL